MARLARTCALVLFVCDGLESPLRHNAIVASAVLATVVLTGAIIALAIVAAGFSPTSPSFRPQAQPSAKSTFSTQGQKDQRLRSELKELKEPVWGKTYRGIDHDDLGSNTTDALATAPQSFITRQRPARMWMRARSALRQSCRWQGRDSHTNFNSHLPEWFPALLTPSSTLRVSRGQSFVFWAMCLSILVATVSAEGVASLAANQVDPEMVAYDPLTPVADQLKIAAVAGVPPLLLPANAGQEEKKERAYIQRFKSDRVQRHGSLHVELTPEDIEQTRTGSPDVAQCSKESLPWESIDVDSDANELSQDDEFSALDWSYLPWGDESRYEPMSDDGEGGNEEGGEKDDRDEHGEYRKERERSKSRGSQRRSRNQDSFLAQADIDSGAGVVDDRNLACVELKAAEAGSFVFDSSPSEKGRILKNEVMGKFGSFSSDFDPNVSENIKEVIDPQVWDAVGVSQKGQTGTREYVEVKQDGGQEASARSPSRSNGGGDINRMEVDADSNADIVEVRPRLDQIDLLGHGPEIDDRLDEVEKAKTEWKEKYHHHDILAKDKSEEYGDAGDPDSETKDRDHKDKAGHGLKETSASGALSDEEPKHMQALSLEESHDSNAEQGKSKLRYWGFTFILYQQFLTTLWFTD